MSKRLISFGRNTVRMKEGSRSNFNMTEFVTDDFHISDEELQRGLEEMNKMLQ